MNREDIIAKAREAGFSEWAVGLSEMPSHLEHFAKLIVLECAGVADHSNVTGKSIIGQRIKEHFGVEDRAVPILSADEQALFAGITSSGLFTIEATKKAFGVEE